MRILVVGASGYIGGRLVPLLAGQGHELILMSRDARPLAARFPQATVVAADLLDPSTLPSALERIEVAYYLAHSMGAGEWFALSCRCARRARLPLGAEGMGRQVLGQFELDRPRFSGRASLRSLGARRLPRPHRRVLSGAGWSAVHRARRRIAGHQRGRSVVWATP